MTTSGSLDGTRVPRRPRWRRLRRKTIISSLEEVLRDVGEAQEPQDTRASLVTGGGPAGGTLAYLISSDCINAPLLTPP